MKCRKCGKKAVIKLYHHNLPLCREDFLSFVEERVRRVIREYKMLRKGERVLVVVSGGKDSLTLAFILKKLGYRVELLHVDLGIGEYSRKSRQFVEDFSRGFNLPLRVVSLPEEWGRGVGEMSKDTYKSLCSLCGMVKRYYFNRIGYEGGYDAVATGHNLDDTVSALLSNLLGWRVSYISKQLPVLPEEGKLKRKIKPLIFLTERETSAYAFLAGISYLREECPYSESASFLRVKHLLNQMEVYSPGTKFSFYLGFLKNRHLFDTGEKVRLRDCLVCGFPTVKEICSFCKTLRREEVKEYASKI